MKTLTKKSTDKDAPICRGGLVFYCQTTIASTAPRRPRRTCCPYAYVLITVLRVSRSGVTRESGHAPP